MQRNSQAGQAAPIGVVYNTSMTRPDAALALSALYIMENKREAKVGAACVTGAGFDAAVFCDVINRFYVPGPPRNGNAALAIGYAVSPAAPNPPMVKAALARTKDTGGPQYVRGLQGVGDSSQAPAVLRNGATFNATSVMVLSAPAASLAKAMDILGAVELFKERIKQFVIVDTGAGRQDAVALRKVLAEWPTPIVYCGRDVGEALLFPGADLEKAFAWAPVHPVVDAYTAFKPMPYDAPLYDLAAVHYAVHPTSGFFTLSGPGSITVANDGGMTFAPGSGNVRRITLDSAKRDQALAALVAIATAQPVAAPARGRGGA